MSVRIIMIELRRSAAPWIGLLVFAAGWAALSDPERWTGRWNTVIASHRGELLLLWPLVLAAAAWLARRERASRMDELLDSTPRPGRSRALPRAAVLVACVAGGYLMVLAAYLSETVFTAGYQPPGWLWQVSVATLSISAAALVGLGLGRAMPFRLIPPTLLILGVTTLTVLLIVGEEVGPEIVEEVGPGALLLAPGVPGGDDFTTVAGRAIIGQALWFSALAIGGFLLLAVRRRPWRAAAVPVLLGLAIALPVLPRLDQATLRDAAAIAPVCTTDLPKVCVTKVYEPVLEQLVVPARRALQRLGRLPDPPTAVLVGLPAPQTPNPANVRLDITVDRYGMLVAGWPGDGVEALILDGAGTVRCGGDVREAVDSVVAARLAAAAWLEERPGPPMHDGVDAEEAALIRAAWTKLTALPAPEQLVRVAALRAAALNCQDNLYDILTAPSGQR